MSVRTQPELPVPDTAGATAFFLQKDPADLPLIDAFSGMQGATAGFRSEPLVEAMATQMRYWPYALAPVDDSSEPSRRLALALQQAAPGDLNHVWFTESGATAMDLAVRTVVFLSNACKQPQCKHFIAVERSDHGSVGAAAGLTGIDRLQKGFDLPEPTQHHIPSPYPYRHPAGPDARAVLDATVQAFRDKTKQIGRRDVAAFVCEPIQCAGGVIVPPTGFLRAMRDACDEEGVLMIVDERATAFRMSGIRFACELDDISPDILIVGSGLTLGYLPLGAMILSDRLHRAIDDGTPGGWPFKHVAHPASAAAALAAMSLMSSSLLTSSQESAGRFQDRLRAFADHPLVGDARGRGLLGGLELVRDKRSKARLTLSQETGAVLARIGRINGLVFKVFSDGILGLAPPLCITPDVVDLLMDRLRATLDQFQTEWSAG